MNKTASTLIVLTFIGMVGIYIGAYYAYQKYKSYKADASVSGALNLLGGAFGG